MNDEDIKRFAEIPQIPRAEMGFITDLQAPAGFHFRPGTGCCPGETENCLANGFRLPAGNGDVPDTAGISLRRVLAAKGVRETPSGYPIRFVEDASFGHEEYQVAATARETVVTAADADGMRRGIYFLEDRIREAEGPAVTGGRWRRRPFIRRRISRCFFGPTYRPPFLVDELSDDVDYYPDEYLNKLAHEGINGLWITMYFRDLPSSIFPHFGRASLRRLEKLRRVVEKCASYGIKIYVLFSEPKGFGNSHFTLREDDAAGHPELVAASGEGCGGGNFCTSTEAGKKYLGEALEHLFAAVPELGGMINIMLGEDNGSCISRRLLPFGSSRCPACNRRDPAEVFREQAEIMRNAMRKTAKNAEFIGWFYAPGQRDGSAFMHRLADAVGRWPDDCGVMFNFESGGISRQLGKDRNVFDYSLAYIGPSELFREVARKCAKPAAKLQVGCSHENASVPFIPVPSNLYEKYRIMRELGVYAVLQCWYFGNYPGLMNRAAGMLSFEPFPASEDEFLEQLARPDWRKDAPAVVRAWKHFARGYRMFPANLAFAWYGPLHHSIAWPLHLFPADAPIAPSWLLHDFPAVSGDRIGECLIYQHTLPEAIRLCREMRKEWRQGIAILNRLAGEYAGDPARTGDIVLADAIGIQIESTCNFLQFYAYREEMFHYRKNRLAAMKTIVLDEIANTEAMIRLCRRDSRLGYHSEAEGCLFFPAKLEGRIKLLRQLLDEDFPRFDPAAAWIDEYTGADPKGTIARCRKKEDAEKYPVGQNTGMYWKPFYDEEYLHIEFSGFENKAFDLEIEPCRLWPPARIHVGGGGTVHFYEIIFREPPDIPSRSCETGLTISIPLLIFEGYRRKNFPMRVNIRSGEHAWVDIPPLPPRLLHENYNPQAAGWLLFE